MQKGKQRELKLAFLIIKISPLILYSESKKKLEPNWVAGFASGD